MTSLMKSHIFDPIYFNLIISFLRNVKIACSTDGIQECASIYRFFFFIKNNSIESTLYQFGLSARASKTSTIYPNDNYLANIPKKLLITWCAPMLRIET